MAQSTLRWIFENVKSLRARTFFRFTKSDVGVVNSALAAAELKFKDRIFTPSVTFSLFLLLVPSFLPPHLKNSGRRRSRLACSITPIRPSAPRHRTSDP